MTVTRSNIAALFLAYFVLGSSSLQAQAVYRGTDFGGFQPHRGYHTFESFEHLDTTTGNLLLTFTDLVLPGNAGRDLVFQRTYNNQWITSPINVQDTWRWSFGFPGMVMRVIEQSTPGGAFPTTLAGQVAEAPVLVMADGSKRATVFKTYLNENVAIDGAFRVYDRITRTLHAPDGIVAQYDSNGYLVWFEDPFHNWVTLDRTTTPGAIVITQSLGGVYQRQVRLDLDSLGQVTSLTYLLPSGNRVWTYDYTDRNLERVTPPLGPDWVFTYGSGFLETITTPGGGVITYGYTGSGLSNGVPYQRSRSGPGVQVGEWSIAVWLWGSETLAPLTEIATPSGARHRYENYSTPPTVLVLGAGSGFTKREINNAAGVYFEREYRTYLQVGIVHQDTTWFSGAQIQQQTFTHRDPDYPTSTFREHYTQFSYANGGTESGGTYHRPWRTVSWDHGAEETTIRDLTYVPPQSAYLAAYIVGLPATETISTQSYGRAWTYNNQTGFLLTDQITSSAGTKITTYAPTGRGNVLSVTTPSGKTTSFVYAYGRVASIQQPEPGSTTTFAINPDGTVASETQAGRMTTYAYDALMRLKTIQAPGGTNQVVIDYDNQQNQFVTTTRDTAQTTMSLDGFGTPILTVDLTGVRARTGYDAEGRVTYQGYPHTPGAEFANADIGVNTTYDILGRPTIEERPGGVPGPPGNTFITRTYRGTEIDIENERGLVTTLTLNGRDQVVGVKDTDNKNWVYRYHDSGELHEIEGPDGLPEEVTRNWEYDDEGRLASETHPESGTLVYEEYDSDGLLKRSRDAEGLAISYTYDLNNRLKTVTAGPRVTTFTYEVGSDNIAQVTVSATATAPGVGTTFQYDPAGRVKKRVDTIDGKVFESRYDYDDNDNLKEVVYPSGRRVGYQYGVSNRLNRVYNLDTQVTYANGFAYDGSGALRSFYMGNGIQTIIDHDPATYRVNALSSGPLQLTYAHDPNGNVDQIGDSRGTQYTQTFAYDNLDRILSANGIYGSAPYNYDAHGNRQSNPGGLQLGYDPNNRFRLTSVGGLGNYQYLANGNLASETAGTYTYTHDNLLDSTTLNSLTTRFAYDGQGWRIRKLVEQGPTYYYTRGLSGALLSEWMNTSTTTATARDYIYAGSRLLSVITKTDLQPK